MTLPSEAPAHPPPPIKNIPSLTERESRTGEYWPEIVAVRTERSEVRTKTTEGQYSPVRLEQARLVSSLLYGTRVMLVSKLPAFENKKYTSYDHFHGNGPYGKIPTKKEPIRTPGFTPRLPCHIINMLLAGWEVRLWKTVTEVLKMLPEAAGRGQHFQARGHSFSLYGPTLSRTITCLSFFLAVNWLPNECHS